MESKHENKPEAAGEGKKLVLDNAAIEAVFCVRAVPGFISW